MLNYQQNGLLSLNYLSTNSSYVLQGLSALNHETDIQVCTPVGFVFLCRHPNHPMLWNYGQALFFSNQDMTYKRIDNVHFTGKCTLGIIGIRGTFIYNRTTLAHH